MAKKSIGKILIIPRGNYDSTVIYNKLHLVKYKGTSYLCKKNNISGIEPTDDTIWYKMLDEIDKIDVFFDDFDETEERENIKTGETLSTLFSKIKKWFKDLKPIAFNGTTESKTVTTPGQYAADAVQLNPGVKGTLAHSINQINSVKVLGARSSDWMKANYEGNNLSTVIYDGSKFVASDEKGIMCHSTDGINWTVDNAVNGSGIETGFIVAQIIYHDGKYYAICMFIPDDPDIVLANTVYYSTDGINWTKSNSELDSAYTIAYGNGMFVVMGDDSPYYSIDGINWTAGSAIYNITNAVIYGNGKFVAVGESTPLYSTDGINWTEGILNNDDTYDVYNAVTYGNGMFVAVGEDGASAYSTNGIDWTKGTIVKGKALYGVAYGNGRFVSTGYSGITYHSTDGVNWKAVRSALATVNAITYGDGIFIAVGKGSTIYYDKFDSQVLSIADAMDKVFEKINTL